MARFLLVFRPRTPLDPEALIPRLEPVLEQLEAEVDHRTPAHFSAMLRGGSENLRLQLFADVQARAEGPVLELVLMSQEPMGKGSPQTLECLQSLVAITADCLSELDLVFRSDRDGPVPLHG
ncbi:MAG: hypothetical protein VKK62_08755 [Synechococcaceae cyanobacterium]|nr:hypothetical protein [Synechococcaceae cyanobacterium]